MRRNRLLNTLFEGIVARLIVQHWDMPEWHERRRNTPYLVVDQRISRSQFRQASQNGNRLVPTSGIDQCNAKVQKQSWISRIHPLGGL